MHRHAAGRLGDDDLDWRSRCVPQRIGQCLLNDAVGAGVSGFLLKDAPPISW